jgi:glycosyltransferase involved in cell wall biosynthesis
MSLFIIPLEPLVERYTQSWYDNIPKAISTVFKEPIVVVDGEFLTDSVQVGAFLDMNSTVFYKNSQMQKIALAFHAKQVKDGDIFFIYDLEFWGIESIRLMAQLNKVNVRIYGFLHAASYTHEDAFAVAAPYQKYTELGWLGACDGVFVGSHYHKQAVIERRIIPYSHGSDVIDFSNKIHVTGNPLFASDYQKFNEPKEKKLIISNRFDWEKRPNLSLDFAYILKRKHPDLKIVVTTSRPVFRSNKQWLVDYARALEADGIIEIMEGLSKEQYHYQLATSKVMLSNSIEENFGYCIMEACIYNTYPLVRNAYSHPELLEGNKALLFDDEDEIVEKIELLLQRDMPIDVYADKYYDSVESMAKIMVKWF